MSQMNSRDLASTIPTRKMALTSSFPSQGSGQQKDASGQPDPNFGI